MSRLPEIQQINKRVQMPRTQDEIRADISPEPTDDGARDDEEYVRAGEVLAKAIRHMHFAIDAGQCPRQEWEHLRLAMGWPSWV